MDKIEEKEIISQIIAGDKNSYGRLVSAYQDMVYTICKRILRNEYDAQEVAQDAFLQAYHKMASFQAQSKFSTWLYTITYRLAISKLRETKRSIPTSSIDNRETEAEISSFDWPDHLEEVDRKTYIGKSLESLNEAESVALTLFYIDECPVKEVAQIMERTESSVKVLLFRGRKNMMLQLQSFLKGELKTAL